MLDDEEEDTLPDAIKAKWNKYKHWNHKVMSRVFPKLQAQRGAVCHAEHREAIVNIRELAVVKASRNVFIVWVKRKLLKWLI